MVLDLNECAKYNLNTVTGSFFNTGYNDEIDELQTQINEYEAVFFNNWQ